MKKGLRLKEFVWIVCPQVSQVLCPIVEVESVGNSFGSSVCVPVVPLSVLVVTVLFSNVTVVCDVVISGSDCAFVEPQTPSLSRKREASVALECERETNIE